MYVYVYIGEQTFVLRVCMFSSPVKPSCAFSASRATSNIA